MTSIAINPEDINAPQLKDLVSLFNFLFTYLLKYFY